MGVVAMNYNLLKVRKLTKMMIMIMIFMIIIMPKVMKTALQWSGGGFSQSGSSAEKDERRVQARYHY